MVKKENLSNPFSKGGGGVHFEAHIEASFVSLMLTGGYRVVANALNGRDADNMRNGYRTGTYNSRGVH